MKILSPPLLPHRTGLKIKLKAQNNDQRFNFPWKGKKQQYLQDQETVTWIRIHAVQFVRLLSLFSGRNAETHYTYCTSALATLTGKQNHKH